MSDTCPTAPSSASVCGLLDGQPGAVPKFIGHWMLRSALIMPGLAVVGVRDSRLVTGALLSSTFVSLFLVSYTIFERNRQKQRRGRKSRRRNGFGYSHAFARRPQRALARGRGSAR